MNRIGFSGPADVAFANCALVPSPTARGRGFERPRIHKSLPGRRSDMQ